VTLLPREVAQAAEDFLASFNRRLTQASLLRLRWNDLRTEGNSEEGALLVPLGTSRFFAVAPGALGAVKTLWDYARGDTRVPVGPFIPDERGGTAPLSLRALRAALADLEDRSSVDEEEDATYLDAVAGVLSASRRLSEEEG